MRASDWMTTKFKLAEHAQFIITLILPYCFNSVFSSGQTNGVLFVGKEERATKIAPAGQEVVISVVENPRKPATGPSEEITKGAVVLGKKRPKSLLSDITTTEKSESALLINGPFVASEMLRNVAKRQRRHPDDASHVNGSSEQKGPMAWDELVRAQHKPLTTSPKLPIAVNGVRLDILSEHAKDSGCKPDAGSTANQEKNLHAKTTNVTTAANTTNLSNHGNMANAGNHGNANNSGLGNQGIVTNTSLGNHGDMANKSVASQANVTSSTTNHSELKSPGIGATNFVPGGLPPVAPQGQSSGGNAGTQSVTTTVVVKTNANSSSDNPRGGQAAGVVLPFRCLWAGCNR